MAPRTGPESVCTITAAAISRLLLDMTEQIAAPFASSYTRRVLGVPAERANLA
jgi:hypothetical protein